MASGDRTTRRTLLGVATGLLLLAGACERGERPTVAPVDLIRGHTCAVDGMILLDHPGPKAQIVWRDGHRSFYCEVREAVEVWVDPSQRRRIVAFFVQDFGGVPWGTYTDRWLPAGEAIFVIDSRRQGSMGVSYVPFRDEAAARAFQRRWGGRLVRLAEITPAVLAASAELQRRRLAGAETTAPTPP